MMGGRGPIPCKFGVQCRRQDCWYAHPDGRIIDAGGLVGPGPLARGNMARAMLSRPLMPPHMGMPQPSPRMVGGAGGSAHGGGGATGGNDCRYSFDCKRRDCHFNHPFGRAIDGDGGGGVGGPMGRPGLTRFPSTSSISSLSRAMSEVSFGSYAPSDGTDEDQVLRDTWFPQARDCPCCKGYMYGCTLDICESMGQCTCSIEEKDLHGGGSLPSLGPMNDVHLAPHVGVNGTSAAHGQFRKIAPPPPPQPQLQLHPRPPLQAQPPRDAIFANSASASRVGGANVSGSAAPSSRERTHASLGRGGSEGGGGSGVGKGGGIECRYGVACSRIECSYRHPKGRNIDMDGVSFGDFGAISTRTGSERQSNGSGGGGDGGVGGRGRLKRVVDQDLMDTWYPDCRECACCKGYKHGCKAAACAEEGICACCTGSAGDHARRVQAASSTISPPASTNDNGGLRVGLDENGPKPSAPLANAASQAKVSSFPAAKVPAKGVAPRVGTAAPAPITTGAAEVPISAPTDGSKIGHVTSSGKASTKTSGQMKSKAAAAEDGISKSSTPTTERSEDAAVSA